MTAPTRCACVHDDRYECMRLRYSLPPEFNDDGIPREACECACHDDYEAVCNDEGRDE